MELEKKAIYHFFLVFNSKPCNSQNQLSSHSTPTKVNIDIRQDSIRIIYTGAKQSMDISIG